MFSFSDDWEEPRALRNAQSSTKEFIYLVFQEKFLFHYWFIFLTNSLINQSAQQTLPRLTWDQYDWRYELPQGYEALTDSSSLFHIEGDEWRAAFGGESRCDALVTGE